MLTDNDKKRLAAIHASHDHGVNCNQSDEPCWMLSKLRESQEALGRVKEWTEKPMMRMCPLEFYDDEKYARRAWFDGANTALEAMKELLSAIEGEA